MARDNMESQPKSLQKVEHHRQDQIQISSHLTAVHQAGLTNGQLS
jgi:hypothetical protein